MLKKMKKNAIKANKGTTIAKKSREILTGLFLLDERWYCNT
jgi:hypothetical protein